MSQPPGRVPTPPQPRPSSLDAPRARPRGAAAAVGRAGEARPGLRAALHLAGCLAVLTLAGCFGATGTVSVSLVTAPGSTLLDSVERIRLTLSEPHTVVESTRRGGGFSLSLEAPADGDAGHLTVECFNSLEQLVGYGVSPDFTVGPIDASVAIYVAAPLSVAPAPVKLAVPRFELGSAPLRYGAVLAGGRSNDNAARGELEIYNAFSHSLTRGLDLPQPRSGPALAATFDGGVYLMGGATTDGTPQGGLWRFDTNVAPAGTWQELTSTAAPRAGERALPLSLTRFLLTGAPALLDAGQGAATALDSSVAVPRAAAAVLSESAAIVVGANATRVVRYRDGAFDELAAPAALRAGPAVVATSDGQIAVIGGEIGADLSAGAVKLDPRTGAATALADVLEIPRKQAAAARAGDFIVLAGGLSASGAILDNAEILDGATLAHLATVPLSMPRVAMAVEVLPNGQILLAGGLDGRGRASDLLELFTPRPQ